MKLGRNFTNTLIPEVLDADQRGKVIAGEIDLFSMNALGILKFKRDLLFQVESASKLGLNWLEVDCDIPNPYLDYTPEEINAVRKKAGELGIELSVHLSYSGMGKEVASIQDYERGLVAGLHRKYLDFAAALGARSCVLHPGTAPFYFLSDVFLKQMENALLDTLRNIVPYATERGIKFHLENNVSFDNIYWETEDVMRVVKKAREEGLEVYFNFDIGHWFTRSEKGRDIPDNFLDEMRKIPPEYVWELHLNDFVPKKIIFHPPLIDTPGLLSPDILREYFSILRDSLKPEVVVLETAFKTAAQLERRWVLLEEETRYIREMM